MGSVKQSVIPTMTATHVTIARFTGRAEGFNTKWNINNFSLSTKFFDILHTEKITNAGIVR
jgi:hypothetical protein